MSADFEPERHIVDPALGLDCLVYGYAPIQADGRLGRHPLYFRARRNHWDFVLCINADLDPSVLSQGETPGFFREGELEGFALWGDYEADPEAGYMPYEVAERIIRECSTRYLATDGRPTTHCSGPLRGR